MLGSVVQIHLSPPELKALLAITGLFCFLRNAPSSRFPLKHTSSSSKEFLGHAYKYPNGQFAFSKDKRRSILHAQSHRQSHRTNKAPPYNLRHKKSCPEDQGSFLLNFIRLRTTHPPTSVIIDLTTNHHKCPRRNQKRLVRRLQGLMRDGRRSRR
jgi:hypothetical protein